MKKRFVLFVGVATLIFSCVGGAGAALISQDWQSSGDQLITLDTDTGLEWLDWSYTINRSFIDVSSELGPGGEFEGFVYATYVELTILYTNVGFTFPTMSNHSNEPLAQNFTNLFGITYGSPGYGGVEAWYDHSTVQGEHWITAIEGRGGGLVQPEWFSENDYSTISFAGSAIVRTSAPVPEPATMLLLGSGLVGLAGFRRRKFKK